MYGTSNASPYQQQIEGKYIVSNEGREGDNYIIYCVGTETWENQIDRFTPNQLDALDTFLSGAGNDKPIIVLAHFPLHRWQSNRRTESADAMIDILNAAVARGQKIIFLWGHNHSRSDTNYDEIFLPGSPIEYISGTTKTIDFIYAAAGCMSDTEYVGSSTVKGKGLVITINDKKQVAMTYLDAYGNDVTEGGTYTEQDPVDVTGVSVDPTEASIEVRKNIQLKATVEPKDATNKAVTWSSSDTSVATVSETGKVKGVGEGKATITVTTEDGGMTAECTVTVTPRTTPDKPYVIASGGYALSIERSPNTASGSGSNYRYMGLTGVEFASGQPADDSIRWIFEETDGGYYIMSTDGRYLNAIYTSGSNSGRGELKLDDTPDVWVLDSGYSLDDGIVDGSRLMSTNATQGSGSAKYLGYEESPANLFTIRSSGSADPVSITEAIDPIAVTGVSVDPTEASIEVRKNVQLTATVEPEDATNKALTWSSSNTSVAIVDQNGKVRGIREGKVTITATTKDGGMTADCTVTVTASSTPVYDYVITIGGFALSTEPTDDQHMNSSGSQRYYYTGLDGVEYPVDGDIPDNIRWIIEETDGGYYIISLDGRYLNATYETNDTGGKTGTLKLDDTPDVWTLDGSLDDWEISGSKLKSTNAGKSMTHEESSSPSGGSAINLFTVRSEGESSELIDTTEHKLTKTDAVDATCTTAGNSAYWTCSDCGKFFSDENGQTRIKENGWVIDALGHDMTAHKAVAATCEEAGNSAYWSCGRCGKFYSDADGENEIEENSWVIKALGHDMTEHKAVAATCTEAGNSAYWSCGRCGAFYSDEEGTTVIKENSWVIDALGHDWGEGEVTKPATCEEDGVRTYTCKNDPSHTKTEVIKALGHDWGEGEITKPATCEEDGVKTYTCKNDPSHTKTEVIKALGHDWGEGVITKPATCEEDGVKTYTCKNDPTHTKTEEIKALGHDWDDGKVTTPATCEEDGVKTYTCKNDPSHTKTEKIAALGHNWDSGTVTTAATCTETGVRTYTCQNDPSHTRTETIAALGHRLTAHRAVAVTCEADGNTAYWSCSRCRKFFSDAEGKDEIEENSWVIGALGHKWNEGEVTTEPTCTTAGVKTFTCQNDSSHTYTEEIAALGHDMTEHKAVAATCEEAGNSAYWSCERCGKFFSDEEGTKEIGKNSWVINALGHDWGDGEVTKPATCEEAGVRTYTCKNDPSHTRTEAIAALGHRLTAHRAVAATCEADGNTAYWSCSRCRKFFSDSKGENEIEENSWVVKALGHKWDEGKVTTEPTCTTAGVKTFTCQNDSSHTYTEEIAALGHDMTEHKAVAATCEEAGNSAYWSCERCGKFFSDEEGTKEIRKNSWVINALGHDWGDGEVTKPATCEEAGVRSYTCKNDPSHTKTEEIAALGHDWDEGEVTTEPTCTTAGVKSFVCQNDKSHTKTEEIAALGHELTRHRRVSATCTEDGNTAYWSCSRCKKFFSDAEAKNEIEENSWVIPALGHNWNEGEVTTEPTCTTAGVKKFTCQNNWAHTKTEEIPALGHNLTEHKAVSATCTEAGNSAYWSCERCGKFFSDAEGTKEIEKDSWVIDALGHDWDEGEITRPATCTTAGARTYTCQNDPSHTRTVSIPRLGHNWDEGEVTTEPTCTTAGVKTFTCKNDPSHTRTETIAALGHNMTEHQAVAATCEEAGNSAYWSCDRCSKFFSDANGENEIKENSWVIAALGHKWAWGRVIREATCTEPGLRRLTCQNNWAHTTTEEIAPLGHNMTAHEAVSETCDTAGNSAYWSCDRCKKFFSDAEGENEIEENSWVIEALGHNMTEHKAVAATCTEAGNSAYWSCDRCKKFFSDAEGNKEIKENGWVINALGHKAVEIPAVLPTCEGTGSTAGEKCSVCGEILTAPKEIAAIGHKWNEGQVTTEPTCTEKGVRTYTCQNDITHTKTEEIAVLGHDLKHHDAKAASCTEIGWEAYDTCSRCDYTTYKEIKALGHDLEHHDAKAASCTEIGWDAYDTCSRCDYTTYKEIKALGHKWGEWTVTKPATEEEEGEEARTCSRCGDKETREIPKLGHVHSMKKVEAVAPTCTEDGNIEYWQCEKCKRYYSNEAGGAENELNAEDLVAKATGHDWNKGEVTTEPTCTKAGVMTFTCQNDPSHTKTEDIAALGHDLEHHDAKAASCTEIGWDAYDACSRCDYTTYKEIKALGHKWGEWEVTKPATEEEEGEEARTCSRCEKKETRAIPKLEPSVEPIPISPGGNQSSQTGRDGTAVGPGASAEVAEQAIISMKTDGDPKGAVFSKLTVRSPKQTKNSIRLKWKKVSKATSYVIYGNKCGTKNKPKKLAEVSGNTKTFKKILKRKLQKGTYYKFIIVALDKDKKVVSTSKLIHVATKGGKVGNHKSVSVKKSVLNNARRMKVGSSLKLKAKAVPQSAKKKVKKHVAIRYESTNKKVATVSGKGIVKARKKGTCYIYAYAQSGVYKRIKVIVK